MNILIVDDHEIVRDGLSLLIQDFFPVEKVLFASEGREAIIQARNHAIDLVLLDLSMPDGMDGLQTAVELRRILPQAKIVIFSMYDEEAYQRKAYESGVDGYLVKRLKGEDIVKNLQEILRGKKIFSEKIIHEQMKGRERKSLWELPITRREQEVFILTVLGHSQKEIAEKLNITVKTVENHRQNISKKIGTHKKNDWIELAKKYNMLDLYL